MPQSEVASTAMWQLSTLSPLSGRTLELAGRVASCNGAVQAGFANIDTLAELLRIIIPIVLRGAHSFLLSVSGLLLRTRSEAYR
jgi:hypothetical protein